jgi:hypothetical protein
MSSTFSSKAATAFYTMFVAIMSSTRGIREKVLDYGWVWACTFCSYCVTAAKIFASIFFNIVSSLIPSLACRLDSVRAGATILPAFFRFCCEFSRSSCAVRATTWVSAASNRDVSWVITVGSGVLTAGSGVCYLFTSNCVWEMAMSLFICACILCCFCRTSVWKVANFWFYELSIELSLASSPTFGSSRYSFVSRISFSALSMWNFRDAMSSFASRTMVRF